MQNLSLSRALVHIQVSSVPPGPSGSLPQDCVTLPSADGHDGTRPGEGQGAWQRQELLPIRTASVCYWQTMAAVSKECEEHIINNLLKSCQCVLGPCLFLHTACPLLNAAFIGDVISA